MRIKRENDRGSARRMSARDQRSEHALMATMHAIEIADRHPAIAVLIRLLKAALDVHLAESPNIQIPMSNFQIPMSNECPSSSYEPLGFRIWSFIGHSLDFGHWDLVIGSFRTARFW